MTDVTEAPYVLLTPWGSLAARIFRPIGEATAVITVSGSWLTVKEQMSARYARALADRGFCAVTFDFPGFGESHGVLRQAELPAVKTAVIAEVARQVSTMGLARRREVGHLAVCASAQYALAAIAQGAPITAMVAVAGWFHDPTSVAALYGGAGGVAERLDRGRAAAAAYLATKEVSVVPAYREGDEQAAMFIGLDYYADAGRGAIPEWRNEMAELSWEPWLQFDGLLAGDRVDVPVHFVHSDDCVLPDNVRALTERLSRATLTWSTGFQTDFYDLDPQVSTAADAASRHFTDHLH